MCVLWPGGRWRIKERFSAASSNCCLSSLRVALWLTKCSFTTMVLCWLRLSLILFPSFMLYFSFCTSSRITMGPVSLLTVFHGQPAATPVLQTHTGIILTSILHHFIQDIKYMWAHSPHVFLPPSLHNYFSLFEAISQNCALFKETEWRLMIEGAPVWNMCANTKDATGAGYSNIVTYCYLKQVLWNVRCRLRERRLYQKLWGRGEKGDAVNKSAVSFELIQTCRHFSALHCTACYTSTFTKWELELKNPLDYPVPG